VLIMVPKTLVGLAAIAVWLSVVAVGFVMWERYDAAPGPALETAPSRLPSGFRLEIVMFVHPRCPCSRVNLAELARATRNCDPDVAVRLVFVQPKGVSADWERGQLWDKANALSGIRVTRDIDATEPELAGATTSGTVLVYDAAGAVVFRGGLTRARGREGDNPGRRAIVALLAGLQPEMRATPVFGCELLQSRCLKTAESELPCRR
jgi:hypothetical protein